MIPSIATRACWWSSWAWARPELAAIDARVQWRSTQRPTRRRRRPCQRGTDALVGVYADPPQVEALWFRAGIALGGLYARAPGRVGHARWLRSPTSRGSARPSSRRWSATPTVFCLGEDIGAYGGAFKVTEGLQARFGEQRVIDTPISEIAIVGAAAGAAHMGMRPVCEMQFIDFISCAYDMLTNYVATARYRAMLPCPMVVRGPSGGYVRGGPFHSQNPEAAFLHTPGLKIVYPATASDAKGLLKAAIRDDDCVLFFEHKYLYRRVKEELPAGDHIVPIGQGARRASGRDLSIITYAATVWKALEAADQLEREDGLSVEVLDLRTLLPLDDEAIVASVRRRIAC